jgi:transposase-like protein
MRLEEEHLAGKRKSRATEVNRWCKEEGSVVVGGQRLPVTRQRLRTREGQEVRMKSYDLFHRHDERTMAVYQRMLAGVSCRKYRSTIEELSETCGVSKSVVSREIVEATEADLRALCERDLSGLDIRVLLIDGMPLDGQMMVAALGVDRSGAKYLLGFHEGATENAEVCKSLLHDLARRGLRMDHPTLVVLDGSAALRKAAEDFYGVNAVVHRCNFHKSENLRKHLPKQYQGEYTQRLQSIYALNGYDEAEQSLKDLIRQVGRLSIGAASSLEEGWEETLTLHRIGIPPVLRTSFKTTNLIESTFSVASTVMRNVKRWTNAMQRMRWSATAFLRAEKQYRRVRGYRSMQVLIIAVEEEVRKRKNEQSSAVA